MSLMNTGRLTAPLLGLVTALLIGPALANAQNCECTCDPPVEDPPPTNSAPEVNCRTFTWMYADWQCNYWVDVWNVEEGISDPDGDPLTCSIENGSGPASASPAIATLTCEDPYGATGSCQTAVVVVDGSGPWLEVTDNEETFELQSEWVYNWTMIEDACGFAYADNCSTAEALQTGIVGIASNDPDEVIEGELGNLYSEGIAADWFGFMLNLDSTQVGPREYTLTFGVVDEFGNLTTTDDCTIRVVAPAAQ